MDRNEFGRLETVVEMDIDDLLLNKENFRIDFNSGKTESEVVNKLFAEEEIIEMAEDIVSYGGLHPHENLLVADENGKKIVLEGNRRTLAIKCLINQSLVPTEYKQKFKDKVGEITLDFISRVRMVKVVIVDRQDALRIINDKHSDIAYRKWGQVSQWNFVKTAFDRQGKDVTKTAESLGTERSTVIKYCKFYNLLVYIRSLGFWDDERLRSEISKNRLEPTRMTRALEFRDINNSLDLGYTNQYEINAPTSMSKEKFNFVLFKFAKSSLTDVEVDRIDTRISKEDILSFIDNWKLEYDRAHPVSDEITDTTAPETQSNAPGQTATTPTPPTEPTVNGNTPSVPNRRRVRGRGTEKYLRSLFRYVNVEDNRLRRIARELSTVSYTKNPIAALMLIRSLLELCLRYQIKSKNQEEALLKYKRYPTLDDIVKFSITNKDTLFADPSIAGPLQYVQQSGGHRKFLNDVVHDSWIDPETAHVEMISGDLRNFFIAILKGTA